MPYGKQAVFKGTVYKVSETKVSIGFDAVPRPTEKSNITRFSMEFYPENFRKAILPKLDDEITMFVTLFNDSLNPIPF